MSYDMKSGCPSWITWFLVILLISFGARPVSASRSTMNGTNKKSSNIIQNITTTQGSNESLTSTVWTNATTTTKEPSTTTVVVANTNKSPVAASTKTSTTATVIVLNSETQTRNIDGGAQTDPAVETTGKQSNTGTSRNIAETSTTMTTNNEKVPTDADRGDGCKTNDRVYIIGMIVLAALLGVMHIIVAYLVYRVFKTNSLKKTGRNQEQPAASNEETNSRRESDDATGTATVMEGDKANDGGATCTVTIADVEGASDGGATSTATFKEGDKESDGGTACAVTITGGEEVNDGDATVKNGEKASDSGAACTTGPATSGEEISDGATCAAIDTPANQDEGTDVKDTSV